jgi:hypothetical protein
VIDFPLSLQGGGLLLVGSLLGLGQTAPCLTRRLSDGSLALVVRVLLLELDAGGKEKEIT